MPELPEIQALAERLTDQLSGHEITKIDVLQFSALKTVEPSPFDLHGRALNSVTRRGKYLIFDLAPDRLLLHLSQGGRVDVERQPKSTKPKGALFRMRFDSAPALLIKEFGTERKAAWWVLPGGDDGPLEKLGPDPFSPEFEELILHGDDNRRLHTMLRDQRTVAGIGRGFSDDILHRAKLAPFDPLKSLDADARAELLRATHEVLTEALQFERTREGGLPAKLGDRFTIHHRFGQPCPRCGETMQRVSYEAYEVTYCPKCQTRGKILADRRLSRLLK